MEIISHRGYWKTVEEKNTSIAFSRSFSKGFGTETDFRDYSEQLVISHDVASAQSITADDFFTIYKQNNCSATLALNIKADGLQSLMLELLKKHKINNYFVFDMSIPDTIGYKNAGVRFFSRQSEFEQTPAFYPECDGIWLDSFAGTWYNAALIMQHLQAKKNVAIVSSDLHKRDVAELWTLIRDHNIHKSEGVILCTDIPEDAVNFFSEP